jgi:cell pole-organizing protein PopZ
MTVSADDMPEKDQSMDDILASIRRIMLDEQARLQDAAAPGAAPSTPVSASPAPAVFVAGETVLLLDSSMAIEETAQRPATLVAFEQASAAGSLLELMPASPEFEPVTKTSGISGTGNTGIGEIIPPHAAADDGPMQVAHDLGASAEETVPAAMAQAASVGLVTQQSIEALLAPAAAAAAAASVDALLRQLNEERRGLLQAPPSLTLEDVVRSELRPFLKSWLDEHLPPLVEHMVRAEINRLIGRSGL